MDGHILDIARLYPLAIARLSAVKTLLVKQLDFGKVLFEMFM